MSTGKQGTCFWDASELLNPLRERGFENPLYVEGWATLSDGTVLPHAWVETGDDVIDDSDQGNGRRVVGYFGVFRTDQPSRYCYEHGGEIDIPICRNHLCVKDGEHFDADVAAVDDKAHERAEKLAHLKPIAPQEAETDKS